MVRIWQYETISSKKRLHRGGIMIERQSAPAQKIHFESFESWLARHHIHDSEFYKAIIGLVIKLTLYLMGTGTMTTQSNLETSPCFLDVLVFKVFPKDKWKS